MTIWIHSILAEIASVGQQEIAQFAARLPPSERIDQVIATIDDGRQELRSLLTLANRKKERMDEICLLSSMSPRDAALSHEYLRLYVETPTLCSMFQASLCSEFPALLGQDFIIREGWKIVLFVPTYVNPFQEMAEKVFGISPRQGGRLN